MEIESQESFTKEESLEGMRISFCLRKEAMTEIIKAYIENKRLEEHFSRCGSRYLSPDYLLKAQIHRSVTETLFRIIGLFSSDKGDADYYLETFKEDVKTPFSRDMSLILKPEMNN